MSEHQEFMRLALAEAIKGKGTTSPNPMVGAVLVHRGNVLAKGYHRYAGGSHAEVAAIRKVRSIPAGAILYVTLEPCSTVGRTPACTDFILRSGIRQVVVGAWDPNPKHRGRGIRLLRKAGLRVVTGVCREECQGINAAFDKFITRGMPYAVAKMAMSLDGKIATRCGDSRWISGVESRSLVQRMRHDADAVLVGSGTVRRDNPRLTIRDRSLALKNKPFWRIVADSKLTLSTRAKVFQPLRGHITCVATTAAAARARGKLYEKLGAKVLIVGSSSQGISLRDLFRRLAKLEIASVLIEGGPTFLASCLREKLVDKIALFVAPKIIGGSEAPGPVGGTGIGRMREALECHPCEIQRVGKDLLIECSLA